MLKQYLGKGIRKLAHFRYYYSKQQIIFIRLSAVVCFFSNILSFLEFLLNQRKKNVLTFYQMSNRRNVRVVLQVNVDFHI